VEVLGSLLKMRILVVAPIVVLPRVVPSSLVEVDDILCVSLLSIQNFHL
jgi:hypothetical protein